MLPHGFYSLTFIETNKEIFTDKYTNGIRIFSTTPKTQWINGRMTEYLSCWYAVYFPSLAIYLYSDKLFETAMPLGVRSIYDIRIV